MDIHAKRIPKFDTRISRRVETQHVASRSAAVASAALESQEGLKLTSRTGRRIALFMPS